MPEASVSFPAIACSLLGTFADGRIASASPAKALSVGAERPIALPPAQQRRSACISSAVVPNRWNPCKIG